MLLSAVTALLLSATNHPIDGGTIANRPAVDVDLNEARC